MAGCPLGQRSLPTIAPIGARPFRSPPSGDRFPARTEPVCEPILRLETQASAATERRLRQGLANGELELFYQPIVDLDDKRIREAEALMRWRRPGHGVVAPGAFLPAIEQRPIAATLGDWTIDDACAGLALFREAGAVDFCVSVNLFGAQLRGGRLVASVREALDRFCLPPEALQLEITENIALADDDETLAPLRELRALGVGLAFDDFGTGYGSLSLLKRVPLTRLKIDRSFVQNLCLDSRDGALVRAIVALALDFGLDVVAEGVESSDQEQALRRLGCLKGQGFLYGRPMPAAKLLKFIGRTPSLAWAPAPVCAAQG